MYIKNKDNLIYEVELNGCGSSTSIDGYRWYNLNLVCGIDYINPDKNDIQGYVKAERFIESVQYDNISVNNFDECLKDRLEEEGYTLVKKLPKIY